MHTLTLIGHPQFNRQVKIINQIILQVLRIRLNEAKNLQMEELYPILWAYRTTLQVPTKESPFNLAYGMEAMISLEIGLSSARIEQYNESSNFEYWRADLDLFSKVQQQAQIRKVAYRQRVARYYNAKVKPKVFHPGDLVLKKQKF